MTELVLWIITTILIIFAFFVGNRLFYIKGYKAGARHVIQQWKDTLNEEEEYSNEREI